MTVGPLPTCPSLAKPRWIDRFTRCIRDGDPSVPWKSAREEAEALYEACWGQYTQQAADVATGLIEPVDDLAHLFDNP